MSVKSRQPRQGTGGKPFLRSGTKSLLLMGRQAINAWLTDYAPSMGAALSFYTIFSLAPLLVIVIALAGLAFDQNSVREQIVTQLRGLVGEGGAQMVRDLLVSVADPKKSGVAAIAGVCALLIGATSVFAELQSALDRVWRAPATTRAVGLWALLRARLLSFGMVLAIGFLLAVSLALSAALHALTSWWGPVFSAWPLTLALLNALFSFAVVTLLFAFIYRVLPRASIGWGDVGIGALVTALLFELGKQLIGLYLGTSGVNTTFGAAGSLAVLLLWVYYSAQIFLLGAEFTWVYAHEAGSLRAPSASPPRLRSRRKVAALRTSDHRRA
jgi:membrane protein